MRYSPQTTVAIAMGAGFICGMFLMGVIWWAL